MKEKKKFNKKNKQKPVGNKKEAEKKLIESLQEQYEQIDTDNISTFSELPLSVHTQKGLKKCGYKVPTEIQKETIKLALLGKDILGAAKTGSGKTLAFVIPILEKLYCMQWTKLDGVGAIVITPIRELALQIFETLRNVGEHHDFSAGLVIGGKDLKFESKLMNQCNIIICTPGRLLQHMDENPLFECTNMQILVLDEADRCLDMGFKKTMNAIIANLPLERQTLLFSATQTKSVKDLARLSLKDPKYISVHEHAKHSTPEELSQTYTVCELKDKLTVVWSFIRNHLKKKIIIFFSTCKEVKYYYEMFCKLRPGVSLLPLYGTLHQQRRMTIYEEFSRKSAAVLFATDVAARGLDFPEVHWVVQADCPEDVATYIHRVGRTARYHRDGESLLILLPSEVAIVDDLKQGKIPIEKIDINIERLHNPLSKMSCFLSTTKSLYDTAERAFGHYLKSVLLMKNKKIFDINALDVESFAQSLGLKHVPRLPFLEKLKNKNNPLNKKIVFDDDDNDGNTETTSKKEKEDDMINVAPLSNNLLDYINYEPEMDAAGNVAEMKTDDSVSTDKRSKKVITKAQVAKKLLKKQLQPNKKIVFDEEGEVVKVGFKEKVSELAKDYEEEQEGGIDIEKAKMILKEEDKIDIKLFKEKVKAEHKEKKKKLKEKKKKERAEVVGDEESDSEYEPDLSWLPDPDKIYGPKKDSDEEVEDEDNKKESSDEQEEMEVEEKKPKKKLKKKRQKKNSENEDTPPKKKMKKNKIKDIATKLDVNEAEELALLLLKNK